MEEKKVKYAEEEEETEKKQEYRNGNDIVKEEEAIRKIVFDNEGHLYASLMDTADPNVLKLSLTAFIASNPENPKKRDKQLTIESHEVNITSFNQEDSIVTSENYLQLEHMAQTIFNQRFNRTLQLYPRNLFAHYNLNGAAVCVVADNKKLLDHIISKYGKPNHSRRFAVVPLEHLVYLFRSPEEVITRMLPYFLLSYFFLGGERMDEFTVGRMFEDGLEMVRVSLQTASECATMKYALVMLTYSNKKYKITFPSARRHLCEQSSKCAFRAISSQLQNEEGVFDVQNMSFSMPHFVDVGPNRVFCMHFFER